MDFTLFQNHDPSGRFSKESFVMKNYPDHYTIITDFTDLNGLKEIPFKERVFLFLNNLHSRPICKNLNCTREVPFRNSTLGYREYCSTKCISSDPEIKKIKEEKSLIKFGTKTPAESKEIKEKIKKTNLEKWGGNSPMSNEFVKQKSKDTLIRNWGVTNPSFSSELKMKRVSSFRKSTFRENFRRVSLQKYGVEHPWMNKEIHRKTIDFFYSSYKSRIEEKSGDKFKFIGFLKGISTSLQFECKSCGNEFSILTYQFYYRINHNLSICTHCHPISENSSLSQIELFNFISKNFRGDIIMNSRDIIKPYEIDLFIPQLNLAFEFNGVWWHSDKFKNENYHQTKFKLCEELGIKLITIWEDDWLTKKEISESFILNKLGKTDQRIFARNCSIREVDYNASREFLDTNHLQGDCKSSVRLGLYHKGDLVSLMTFSKLRLPLQKSSTKRNESDYFELTRFCNKLNTTVVGGASKILKHFIKQKNPRQIETYSDNLISDGHLYNKLEFTFSHESKPGYWYVIDGIRQHRFNWRKQKLVKMGFDPNKTEEEIMNELGYYKIYNGGNRKWVMNFESED